MLERRESNDGVVWYESALLRQIGVRHAFSTRIGGVSAGVFSSLNLGNPSGCAEQDRRENILENERRLMRAAGWDPHAMELCRVHQVHGCDVQIVRAGQPHDGHAKADAVVTDDASRVVSVRVADCIPVLLASTDGRSVAAVHAGWRGVISGVVPAALESLGRADRGTVRAAIGPGIGMDAFEVGPEVVDALRLAFGPAAETFVRPGRDDRWHADLKLAIAEQLRRAGCEMIDTTDRCTFRDADEFFSHRRDQGVTGRMAAFISPVVST